MKPILLRRTQSHHTNLEEGSGRVPFLIIQINSVLNSVAFVNLGTGRGKADL